MNSYFSFLDYMEMRRNVERALARPALLFVHCVLFVCAAAVGTAYAAYSFNPYPPFRAYFVDPTIGSLMAIWSAALLVHAVRVYLRSGAWSATRERLIENEMRSQLANHAVDYERDLFRIHALLEETIQRRAGVFTTLLIFSALNGFMWVIWAIGARALDSFAWQITLLLAGIFLPVLLINLWNATRPDFRLMKFFPTSEDAAPSKRKHEDSSPSPLELGDDGEILDLRGNAHH